MEVENPLVPHPLDRDICGHTVIDVGGREWICINNPHILIIPGLTIRGGQKHWMINRWPYREDTINSTTTKENS